MSNLHGTTIVFDLDGTLVDTAPDLIRATDHCLSSIGLGPSNAAKLRDSVSFGARRMITDALSSAAHALPAPTSDAEIDRLHGLFLDHYKANIAHSSRPYPLAMETLRTLRGTGARLAVCTNKQEPLARSLLSALAMEDLFDAIAGFETFPVAKPHPGHILLTVELAGGDPRRAIMVGDSENDVKAARAAGLPVIGYLHGYSGIPMREMVPDALFSSYSELRPAIENIVTRWKD